jgi:hypothetical protein
MRGRGTSSRATAPQATRLVARVGWAAPCGSNARPPHRLGDAAASPAGTGPAATSYRGPARRSGAAGAAIGNAAPLPTRRRGRVAMRPQGPRLRHSAPESVLPPAGYSDRAHEARLPHEVPMTSDSDRSPAILTWALALGATGFASGFLGPIALNPAPIRGHCSDSSSPDPSPRWPVSASAPPCASCRSAAVSAGVPRRPVRDDGRRNPLLLST